MACNLPPGVTVADIEDAQEEPAVLEYGGICYNPVGYQVVNYDPDWIGIRMGHMDVAISRPTNGEPMQLDFVSGSVVTVMPPKQKEE